MPTEGSRLMASLHLWQAPPPRLGAEGSGSRSQRGPLLTIMNANGGADAVINGGSKPFDGAQTWSVRVASRGPRVRQNFRVVKSRSILPRASGHRGNIKVLT